MRSCECCSASIGVGAKYMEHSNPLGLEDIFGPKNWSTFDLSLSHSTKGGLLRDHEAAWVRMEEACFMTQSGCMWELRYRNGRRWTREKWWWTYVTNSTIQLASWLRRSTIYSVTNMEATNGILKCMFHLAYQNRTGPWQYGKGVSHRTGGQVSMESCHIGPLDLWMFCGSKFRDWMKSPVSGPWSMCLRGFQWHQIC